MDVMPGMPVCAKCAEPLGFGSFGACIICGRFFCGAHLMSRRGVQHCEDCREARYDREEASGISAADEARVIALLVRDLESTVGVGYDGVVEQEAAKARLFNDDVAHFESKVVEDVQQYFHDSFIDTTWPSCPDHPNHPLDYGDGWWRCPRSGQTVARLGELKGQR
jgi:hypothetical protein